MDPDIKHPRVDEWTAGFERALTGDTRLSVTGIWRENKNIIDSVYPDSRWEPVTLSIPDGPLEGQPIDLYSWTNQADSWENGHLARTGSIQEPGGQVVTTADAFRRYKAHIVLGSTSQPVAGQASYVLSNGRSAGNRGSVPAPVQPPVGD
jgi:hypothetical protein